MTDYLQRHQDLGNLITIIENLSHLSNGATFALDNGVVGKLFYLMNLKKHFHLSQTLHTLSFVMTVGKTIIIPNLSSQCYLQLSNY